MYELLAQAMNPEVAAASKEDCKFLKVVDGSGAGVGGSAGGAASETAMTVRGDNLQSMINSGQLIAIDEESGLVVTDAKVLLAKVAEGEKLVSRAIARNASNLTMCLCVLIRM